LLDLYSFPTRRSSDLMPVDGDDFIVILHPFTWASLMSDPTFVNLFIHASENGDGNPLRSGYVGRILRCKIFVSSNAREYANEGVDRKSTRLNSSHVKI